MDGTNNRVGIGTPTPTGILHIYSATGAYPIVTSNATNMDAAWRYGDGTTTWTVGLQGSIATIGAYTIRELGVGTYLTILKTSGYTGIGTITPDRLFHSESSTANTNTVSYAARFSHITSGTPVAGIGVGYELARNVR